MAKLSLLSVISEITNRQGSRTGAFEFNEDRLNKLVDYIGKSATKYSTEPSNPNSKAFGVNFNIESPITGAPTPIKIYVFQSKPGELSGEASYSPTKKAIFLSLNFPFAAQEVESDWDEYNSLFQELRIALKHELTHFFDIKLNSKKDFEKGNTSNDARTSLGGLEAYLNDPAEIKAYLSEVVADMQEFVARRVDANKPLPRRPEALLGASERWRVSSKTWMKNPSAYKLFYRAAYDVWMHGKELQKKKMLPGEIY